MDGQMERCTDKQEFVGPSPTGIQKYYFLLSFLPPNNDANIENFDWTSTLLKKWRKNGKCENVEYKSLGY